MRDDRRYVVVCRGPHCRERGSMPLRRRLAALISGHPDLRLIGYSCFGQCERGPNVAFVPGGEWYGSLATTGDAERVLAFAEGEGSLEVQRLTLPPVEEMEHRRNVAELIQSLALEQARRRRRWWPFS